MKHDGSILFGALIVASSVIACRDPAATNDLVVLDVQSLHAPATIAAGASLSVVLNVEVGGCLTFDHIQATRRGSEIDLVAWGKDIRTGRKDMGISCPRLLLEQRTLQLDPPFPSSFTLVIDRGRLSPLTATVQVQ